MKRNTQETYSLAVIFTCYNRKDITLRCLRSLQRQKNMKFDLFVCDDASTDGTHDAILDLYPEANILMGTGKLFWTRGMFEAMSAAIKKGFDYYLMINDDVEFKESMWETMFKPFEEGRKSIAVVGYTTTWDNPNVVTYGGRVMKSSKTKFLVGDFVQIDKENYATCDVANWNCFLVDKYVIERVGVLDPFFEHALGDFDYSLRMRNMGLEILVAKDVVGYCSTNSITGTYRDSKLPIKKRIQLMRKPNGFPAKSWMHFCNKHCSAHKFIAKWKPIIINYIKIVLKLDI